MILRNLLAGAMPLLAIALPAVAQADPRPDPRIASRRYVASEVVTINGRGDTQSTIAFGVDERIENVAVGDSAGWQVTPNKRADLLFLKPMRPGARTNMTVVTDRRTYLFDLVSSPGGAARAAPVYMLRFTYADPEMTPPAAAPPASVTPAPPVPDATAVDPVRPDPATFNFAWVPRGDKALLPARTFDDGQSIYLAWPRDVPLPAILVSDAQGVEGPVNYTTHGDIIVVDGVPARLILRSGRQVATLTSALADPRAVPGDGEAGRKPAVALRPGPYYPNLASTDR